MSKEIVPVQRVAQSIRWIRGEKVPLDSDSAALYGVTTGNLNKAMKRNAQRSPSDFMFRLSTQEVQNLRFQSGISRWGGRRALPDVFTEQGIAMLSSVLNTERAIKVSIAMPRREIGFHVREKAPKYRAHKRA